MIPLTTLYDDYIDRPKLSEQKNPVEYIVPPSPLKWGSERTITFEKTSMQYYIDIPLGE